MIPDTNLALPLGPWFLGSCMICSLGASLTLKVYIGTCPIFVTLRARVHEANPYVASNLYNQFDYSGSNIFLSCMDPPFLKKIVKMYSTYKSWASVFLMRYGALSTISYSLAAVVQPPMPYPIYMSRTFWGPGNFGTSPLVWYLQYRPYTVSDWYASNIPLGVALATDALLW